MSIIKVLKRGRKEPTFVVKHEGWNITFLKGWTHIVNVYRVSRFRKEEGKLSLSYIKLHPDLYKNVSIVSLWQTEGDDLRYLHLAPLNTSCSCGAPPISCHHYLCPAFHDVIITRLECNVHTPHICPYGHHCTV